MMYESRAWERNKEQKQVVIPKLTSSELERINSKVFQHGPTNTKMHKG